LKAYSKENPPIVLRVDVGHYVLVEEVDSKPYLIHFKPEVKIISDEEAEAVYRYKRYFWTTRNVQTEDMKTSAVDDYVQAFRNDPSRDKVKAVLKLLNPASMLDFGGATGGIYECLKGIRYTNIEPYAPFVERQLKDFPETEGIVMDAEAFIESYTTEERFDIFFASVSLCMLPPRLVRAVLAKAKEFCDRIVIWDYAGNLTGDISGGPVLYPYKPNGPLGHNFAHPYVVYLQELGSEIRDLVMTQDHEAIIDHCIIHAENGVMN